MIEDSGGGRYFWLAGSAGSAHISSADTKSRKGLAVLDFII